MQVMDQCDALRISKDYLLRLRKSGIGFKDVWLFDPFALGNEHENSNIDIAIILKGNVNHTFETDIQLMVI